jgi:hypothetical protein
MLIVAEYMPAYSQEAFLYHLVGSEVHCQKYFLKFHD